MKIIAGSHRGRPVRTARGRAMRPTSSIVRETLFNLLGSEVDGCHFLDLCAGSGVVGIEALSRGAARVCFVDNHATAIGLIRRNLESLGLESRALVLRRDAARCFAALEKRKLTFGAAFLDPPYDSAIVEECLRSPGWRAIMPGLGSIVIEHRHGLAVVPPAGWRIADSRRFGETGLTVLKGAAPS